MKKFTIVVIMLVASLYLSSCASTKLTAEQQQQIASKIEKPNYNFEPTSALPMGGKTVQLSGGYNLRVSKDTLEAYLPYYGRAYSGAAYGGGGIKFVSKDFEYKMTEKKKGMWAVTIVTKDTQPSYKLYLSIGEEGYTSLRVEDVNRQTISFYGTIDR